MEKKRGRLFLYLLAGLFVLCGLLAAVLLSAGPAQAAVYEWEDTMGPGNGSAETLLCVAERNELYRGTVFRGVWRYNPALGNWVQTGGELGDAYVYSLAWDGTYLYAGTKDSGVWRYDPNVDYWYDTHGSMSSYPVYSLSWDGHFLYAGTDGNGVWRYNPASGTWATTGGGVSTFIIVSLAFDATGVYAGTIGHGVWHFSPSTLLWSDTGGGLSTYNVRALEWTGSHIYAGTDSHGAWRYSPGSGTWATTGGGVSSYDVYSLAWDGDALYAGTTIHGVWSFDPGTLSWSDTGGGVAGRSVYTMTRDRDFVYAGADNGIWFYNPDSDTWTDTGGGVSGATVKALAWGGSWESSCLYTGSAVGGVWRYDPGSGDWTDTGGAVSGYTVNALAYDWSNFRLYAGTQGHGVWSYDPEAGTWANTNGGVSTYTILSLAWSGSQLFAGTEGHSLWSYEPMSGDWASMSAGGTWNMPSLAWDPDSASLYVGTAGHGVWRFTPGTMTWFDTTGGVAAFTILSLAWDGVSLYAGTQGHDLWRYAPGTNTWAATAPSGFSNLPSLAWVGSGIAAGTEDYGVILYNSVSDYWDDLGWGINGYYVGALAYNGVTLSAGTDFRGVWRYGPHTWYLAEGCTDGGMETFVLVQNPDANDVQVSIEFQTDSGKVSPAALQGVAIPGNSRVTFKVNDYVTSFNVSTKVVSDDGDVVCERAMYGNDRAWAHESIGVTDPARNWFLAEGCTDGGMETFVLVQNPGADPVAVDLWLQTESGEQDIPALHNVIIPAGSRRTFKLNDYLTTYNVSTRVEASGNVVCERAMYGNERAWAHDSVGTAAPSTRWFLAEGCTDGGMETYLLVFNPNAVEADIHVSFQTGTGDVLGPQETIPALTRRTYKVNDYVTTYDVSTDMFTTDGNGIVCERAMYGNDRAWATESVGSPNVALTWYLAEGCTDGGMETWVLVQNPGNGNVTVSFTLMTENGAVKPTALQNVFMPQSTRRSFNLGDYVTTYNVSTRVEVVGSAKEIVCERSMYGNGKAWAHDSIGFTP